MKPLVSAMQDNDKLQELGRASIQIVHDLKNQLNGLKLYATFLRKRLEKSDRPVDEQETVTKLINGLQRAADDLSTIVQYGRPVELERQAGVDIQKIMRNVCASLNGLQLDTGGLTGSIALESESATSCGEFDPNVLAEAFRSISFGALKLSQHQNNPPRVMVRIFEEKGTMPTAIIEWQGLNHADHDPFRSFAGSDEVRMSLAAKMIEAHGGSATYENTLFRVRLPL